VNADAADRAISFLRAVDDACAEAIVDAPGGHAIIDSRHPGLWDANHLRVDAATAPPAQELHAAALHHFEGTGVQLITVRQPPVARALADPLAALGYRVDDDLLLVAGAAAVPADPAAEIAEVDLADLAPSRIAAQLEAGRDPDVGRQLASRDALIGTVVDLRCFAALVDGRLAARCQLYTGEGTAQIESVYTAPAHRRRGLSRALLARATRDARAAGAELVFLVADAAAWPQSFYRRAGFRDAGRLHRFKRSGPV
jgi:ribosomal protein S18 acetylase RimI-like enzyme